LAGVGARGDETQYQGLVDQTAVVAQAAHRGQTRRQPPCPQRGQGRLRARARQAQDGDGAAARRRGEGEDGVGHTFSSPFHGEGGHEVVEGPARKETAPPSRPLRRRSTSPPRREENRSLTAWAPP